LSFSLHSVLPQLGFYFNFCGYFVQCVLAWPYSVATACLSLCGKILPPRILTRTSEAFVSLFFSRSPVPTGIVFIAEALFYRVVSRSGPYFNLSEAISSFATPTAPSPDLLLTSNAFLLDNHLDSNLVFGSEACLQGHSSQLRFFFLSKAMISVDPICRCQFS
jgi:hypothetical protein